MNVERVIREVTVRGSAPGMEGVARAYDQVAASSEKGVVAFERNSKASEGADRALEKLRIRYQEGYKEQQKYTEAQETYRRAVEQGRITQEQAASELAAVREQLTENSKAYLDVSEAANDNTRAFGRNGLEIANTANHLKTAAVAAYAFSPAFRRLADPIIATGLRGIAQGASLIGPAAATAAGALLSGFAPVAAAILRVAGPILIVINLVKLLASIFEIGGQKIKEYVAIAANAGAADVGTDYFQRQAKGAEDLGLKTDLATAALKRFKEQSESKLGGSDFDKRLDELTKAGNFQGNPGVAAYKQAVTVEEKYRAVSDLITTAIQRGERLAAIDLAAKFLPPELVERLRANGDLLAEMQAAADAVKPVDIVSEQQIGYASELNRRMEDARKIIDDALKPAFVDLGLAMRNVWVVIVEAVASVLNYAVQIYNWFSSIYDKIQQISGKLSGAFGALGLNTKPEGLVLKGEAGFDDSDARRADATALLTARLRDQVAVQRAMKEAIETGAKVRGDLSRDTKEQAKTTQEANDNVDRALNTLNRHVLTQQADAKAVGLGAKALAEYRAEAQLQAAITANNGKITDDQRAAFERLKVSAGEAAQALEKARVAGDIDFANKTRFASQEDVAIARQLSGLYGNDVPAALASTEAAAIRVNNAIAQTRSDALDFTKDFVKGLIAGEGVMKSLGKAAENLSAKLTDRALEKLFSGDLAGAALAGIGALVTGVFASSQKKKEAEAQARAEYQQNLGAINSYITKANGGSSALSDALASAEAEMNSLVAVAAKAKDYGKVAEIQAAYNLNVVRINAEEAKRLQDAIAARQQSYQDRVFAAANDNDTLQGQLAAADREFAKQRLAETKAGNEAVNDLIAAQEAERAGIIKRFADEARDYLLGVAKSIKDYLTSLQLGAGSTLDPRQRLDLAQSEFQRQYSLAQGGDREALSAITGIAEAYRDQAESYFGRTEAYASIVNQITSALTGLTLPGVVGGEFANRPPIATAPAPVGVAAASNDNTATSADANAIGGAINTQTEVMAQAIADLTETVAAQQASLDRLTKQLSMVLANAA